MLQNELLQLRPIEPEDLGVLYKWENDASLWKYGSTIAPFSRYILKEYIATAGDLFASRQLRLMVEEKHTHEVIGIADLFDYDPFHRKAAVGVLIAPSLQRRGWGKQVLGLLSDYAFGFLGIHMLFAHVPVSNTASVALFKSSGYQTCGTLKDWLRVGDRYEDALLLQLIHS